VADKTVLITDSTARKGRLQIFGSIARALATAATHPSATAQEFKKNYRQEKAASEGKAFGLARKFKNLSDFVKGEFPKGAPRPTSHSFKWYNGVPMVYYTDGSIRRVIPKIRRKKDRVKIRQVAAAARRAL
jgi:hypothetical protein